jgi:hypothetical protein
LRTLNLDRFEVGLPDAQEALVIHHCKYCDGEIYSGEKCHRGTHESDVVVHDECYTNFGVSEWEFSFGEWEEFIAGDE